MERITSLPQKHIFVFGSNLAGIHGAGAAKDAVQFFGAKYGLGEGLYNQSYALPTKNENLKTLSLDKIEEHISKFMWCAKEHPELTFHMTPIGTGYAGIPLNKIAEFFTANYYKDQGTNIIWPPEFVNYWLNKLRDLT